MPKYNDEVKAKCVAAVKSGLALAEVTRQFGPNPKAIQRYCAKAGVSIPKKEKAPKVAKAPAPAVAKK